MAEQSTFTIKGGVILDTAAATKAADKLKDKIDEAVKPRPGAIVKAAANKAAGAGESTTANSLSGSGRGTGSAASDFATQARGLGGLVHVYATFAANIFAVSAAFNALSKAMDITNLVKGLDQIGASSGKNLGSLAKQMVVVADGAISMQQAMSSTAMASAGGMSSQNILRMTEVARKASLALGRDMTDSMDRITKGIIKTQPELLDELGIMTRVIPAQQEYARSIGKTAASLTDFEKRQAFANAVLAEGERKFGAIDLEANPYSKILASTNNLIQSGLELVNKVLGPLMSLLSSSPTGLAVALGAIATILLKQAIPALGMFRENAKKMAEESHQRVLRVTADSEQRYKEEDTRAYASGLAQFKIAKETQEKIAALKLGKSAGIGEGTLTKANKNPLDLSNKELSQLEARHKLLAGKEEEKYKASADMLRAHIDEIYNIRKQGDLHAERVEQESIKASQMRGDHEQQLKKILYKETQQYASRTILASVAEESAVMGPVKAWRLLNDEIAKNKKNTQQGGIGDAITNGMTRAKGAISIATAAVGTFMNAFGVWAQVIGLVVAGFALLDSWITNSSKQSDAFNGSIDTLNSSFSNVDRTLDLINKKDLSEFFSVESIQARANALNDLTSNLSDVINKFDKLQNAQNGWDTFFDGIWDMFGKGSGDKLALGVSGSVISALKTMREGPAKEEAKKSIQDLFDTKVDMSSVKAFNASIKDLDKQEIQEKAKAIESMLVKAAREAGNSASAMTSFKTALSDIEKQSTTMSNSILPKDEFSKMGLDLGKAANAMQEALQDPIEGLTTLRELAGSLKTLSFLPPGLASQLGAAKNEMDKLSVSIAQTEKELADAETRKAKASNEYNTANKSLNTDRTSSGFKALKEALVLEERITAEVSKRLEKETNRASQLKALYAQVPDLLNKASVDLLTKGLTTALNEASVVAAKGYIAVLNAAGIGTANENAAISQQEVSIQMELVKANYANVIAQQGLQVSIDALTLMEERGILENQLAAAVGEANISKIAGLLTDNTKKFAEVVSRGKVLAMPREEALKTFRNKNAVGASSEEKQAMEQMTVYLQALIGSEQQLAKLRAQSGAIELKRRVDVVAEEVKQEKDLLSIKAKNLNTEKDTLDLAIKNSVDYSPRLQAEKEINEAASTEVAMNTELLAVKQKIRTIQIAIDAKGSTDKTRTAMSEAGKEREAIEAAYAAKTAANDSANLKTRLAGEETLRKAVAQRSIDQQKQSDALLSASTQVYEVELNHQKSLGSLKESEYVIIKAGLDISKQKRDSEIATAEAAASGYSKILEIYNELKQAEATPNSDTSGIQARLDDARQSYVNQLTTLDLINTAKIRSIVLTSEQTAMQAKQNEQMAEMQSITDSLATAFGDMGANIGAVGKAMLKFAHTEEKFLAKRVAAEESLKEAKTDTQITAAQAKLNKLDEKHTQDQLDGISEMAGATKKMFDEKSAAHKAFSAIEKVTAAASLALKAQAMAADIAALVPAIMTGKAQLFAQGGWAGFAGVAAFMALMGQGGGGGGAVTPVIPPGLTAEEMQETQGTGTTFGDDKAKSASIQNSLDLIAETTVEGMSYYSEMVSLLTAIKDGIGTLSISLYDVKGIRTGTNFGTVEATSGGGGGLLSGLFGSSSTDTSIINSGIQLQGTFMELANAATSSAASLNQFETVQSTTTSSGALFGLFGGGTSTSITNNIKELDSSVRETIGGIFTGAADLFVSQGKMLGFTQDSVIATLESVDVNKLASLRGLKGKELEEELSAVVGGIMDDAAKTLFPKLGQFKQFNEGYAQTVTRVLDTNDKVRLAFKQLGTPLATLEEVASKSTQQMVDNIVAAKAKLESAKAAVSNFKPTVSEAPIGYGTVTSEIDPSLIKDVAAAEKELAEARKVEAEAASGMTVRNLELTQSYAKAAGGLDKFLDLTAKFTEKYLTASEQLKPRMAEMHTEMARLGIPINTTKEQLKQLILGFDTTNPKQAQYYVDLLKLADAYDTNRSALNDLADSYGVGEDAIKGILDGAVEAASGSGEVGYSISGEILKSIQNAMYEQASSAISSVIFDTVVTPMIQSLMAGNLAADLMNGSFDAALESAGRLAEGVAGIFSNPTILNAVNSVVEKIAGVISKASSAIPSTVSGSGSTGNTSSGSGGQSLHEIWGGAYGNYWEPINEKMDWLKENYYSSWEMIKEHPLTKLMQSKTMEEELKKLQEQLRVSQLSAEELAAEEATRAENALAFVSPENRETYKEILALKEQLGQGSSGSNASQERKSLQEELNQLTMTQVELLEEQRKAVHASNLELWEQVQALKGAKALQKSMIESTELFTPVETLTLKIKELAEQAKAAGAGSSVDDLISSFSSMGIDDVKELAQSILAMTDISDAMKASFLGILNTLAGLKKAEEERIKSLQNSLESTRQSIAQAYQSFVDAEKTARENITSGYLSAQERVKSAQEAINEALRQNAEELKEFANNIREFLLELATTDLGGRSKASQYQSLKEDYAKTYALALTGDTTALGSITSKASELLNLGKEQSSTSLEYAILAGEIGGNLEALATLTDGKAGPLAEAVDPMIALQQELLEATEDFGKWTEAAAVSGASTSKATKDYLAEWRVAQAQLSEAEFLIQQNGINIKLSTTMDSFKTLIEDYGKIKIDLAAAIASLGVRTNAIVTQPGITSTALQNLGVPAGLTAAGIREHISNLNKWYGTDASGLATAISTFTERWKISETTLQQVLGSGSSSMASFAVGTNYVPQDMIAQIHEGEAIVPKAYNPAANGNSQQELIQEIRLLRQEVAELKQASNNTAAYTKKTSDTLTRVTLGGEAMQTQTA